ncbi:MAG TPA: alkaline phosphatase D family protein [Rhodanobacteraceae bacterium]|nr:alkaline phosphatase D family protein [Rhodanobacteraceae bacterium]
MAEKPQLTRRQFLAQATAIGAALAFGRGCEHVPGVARSERRDLFPQGVASGDPAPDSVILWTRRAPDAGASAHRLAVEVARDAKFADIVARGDVGVTPATDWTCRFLAAGLEPAHEYWYRFVDEAGHMSRVGRTLTAPADTDDRPVRFAFVSCQDVTQGACNAYKRMIHEDAKRPRAEQLGFVLHLGDFLYEVVWYPEDSPNGHKRARRLRDIVRYPNGEKMHDFHLPTDLEDYRTAYRAYLQDPDLQDARAQFPFVAMWDNHEFSWRGYQSQQYFDGPRPAQRIKLAASQAWYEFQPARVVKPGAGDPFEAPHVDNVALTTLDARGIGQEPNNLTATHALRVHRAFRFGRNVEMILTDNRSYMSPPADGGDFGADGAPYMSDETATDIIDRGREYNGGHAPATIRFGGKDTPNPQADAPPQAYLGLEQMAWFKQQLKASQAPWKIWGHSFGTLTWRVDPQNLPEPLRATWPSEGYAVLNAGYAVEHDEIFDLVKNEGITGLAIVAGDKHSFWAGYPCKALPPQAFEPVGVEFITGSISAPGLAEVNETVIAKDHPLRALYIRDQPDGTMQCALNMTVLHGVKSALTLKETGDVARARAARNPDVSPNLAFADFGGHGYATVRATPEELATEFVCIPRPMERNDAADGGPLVYRVVHRVRLWRAGERPELRQTVVEGDVALAV